jgi:general secretion pathway protein G
MNDLRERHKPMKEDKKRAQAGFTLIELLIVLIILGLLGALVAPKMFQKVGSAKQKTTKTQIGMLGTALDAYRLDVGQYPKTLESLRTKGEEKNWDGPYLPKDIPNDPWGNPYQYRHPGEHGEYDLYSLGADGEEGGEGENADVVSWE